MPPDIDAYLDIETTGLSRDDEITVVGVYLCNSAEARFVQLVGDEITADSLLETLAGTGVIYTYNGKSFDLPFIRRRLGVNLADRFRHHDLMYDCWKCSLKGGFKAVERQLGIGRELPDMDGYQAVRLWWRYVNDADLDALKTLLEYNREDVVNLKTLREKLPMPGASRPRPVAAAAGSKESHSEENQMTYFETAGRDNTDAVMTIVKRRAGELGIETAVVASYHGYTAEKAVLALDGMRIVVIAGFAHPTTENLAETFSQGNEKLIKSKATVLVATHLLSGMGRAMRKKFGSSSPEEIVGQALRMVGVGIKVGIECAVMAADAGLVGTDEDVIAIAGTGSGADTAIVVRPVNSQDFFDLKVKEILCKPRSW